MIIINPGTEGRAGATVDNAMKVVDQICADLKLERASIVRHDARDDSKDGFFAFLVRVGGKPPIEFDVPGDDPAEVCAGKPFVSRRLYVDGSSWLYGYALDMIEDRIT